MLDLADELLHARLGELLGVQALRSLVERVVRVDRAVLGVFLVEQAEVVDRKGRSRLLVERGNLVQDVDRLLVVTLREQELGPGGETRCESRSAGPETGRELTTPGR